MPDLYIVRAQPNPPGRDARRGGQVTNSKLNEEWVEFVVQEGRHMVGDELSHLTFDGYCRTTGVEVVFRFGAINLSPGHRVRVHTGVGTPEWEGSTLHVYAGRSWYVWNNGCGDRATLAYNGRAIDSTYYEANPPEGVLVRRRGTDRLVPQHAATSVW